MRTPPAAHTPPPRNTVMPTTSRVCPAEWIIGPHTYRLTNAMQVLRSSRKDATQLITPLGHPHDTTPRRAYSGHGGGHTVSAAYRRGTARLEMSARSDNG